jgi:hypothetical protein
MLSLQEKQVHVALCDHMTIEEISRTRDLIQSQYESCGQPLFYVAVVPEDAPIPEQSVRTAMTVALRQIHERCEFTAVIVSGDSLAASMKRTAFAGILMVVMKGKWHVAKSIDELIEKSQGNGRRLAQLKVAARLAAEHGVHA